VISPSVRPFGIRDLPVLRGARQIHVPLSYPEIALYSPLSDMLSALPYGRRFSRVFLALEDDEICGLIQLRPEPREYRWVVTGLAATDSGAESDEEHRVEIWNHLLRYSAFAAGLAGAKRVHAAAPVDGPASQALHRAGFSTYAHQTLLLAHRLRPPDPQDGMVREQEPSDAWSIHHLYHLATPRAVQYAEAFSSNHWDVRRRLNARVRGFLIEHKQVVVAYAQITTKGRLCAMEVIVQPDELGLLPTLVWQSCQLAGIDGRCTIWVSVPDYHREYLTPLDGLGFQEVGRQALMVRYTAVPACVPEAKRISVVAEITERLPARAPSYFAPRHRS
jgi:hypothetical protein